MARRIGALIRFDGPFASIVQSVSPCFRIKVGTVMFNPFCS